MSFIVIAQDNESDDDVDILKYSNLRLGAEGIPKIEASRTPLVGVQHLICQKWATQSLPQTHADSRCKLNT